MLPGLGAWRGRCAMCWIRDGRYGPLTVLLLFLSSGGQIGRGQLALVVIGGAR